MLVSGNGFDNETSSQSSSLNFKVVLGAGLLFTLVIIFMTAGSPTEETKENVASSEQMRLSRYKKSKPKKGTHDWRDYCSLKKKLEKVIDPLCFCECQDGFKTGSINWFNPPEELDNDWIELSEVYSEGGSKHYQNKRTGEIVRHDLKHRDNGVNHYHRYNHQIKELIDRRNFKKQDMYLDICGNVLKKNIDEKNHILIIEKENYKIEEQENCDDVK